MSSEPAIILKEVSIYNQWIDDELALHRATYRDSNSTTGSDEYNVEINKHNFEDGLIIRAKEKAQALNNSFSMDTRKNIKESDPIGVLLNYIKPNIYTTATSSICKSIDATNTEFIEHKATEDSSDKSNSYILLYPLKLKTPHDIRNSLHMLLTKERLIAQIIGIAATKKRLLVGCTTYINIFNVISEHCLKNLDSFTLAPTNPDSIYCLYRECWWQCTELIKTTVSTSGLNTSNESKQNNIVPLALQRTIYGIMRVFKNSYIQEFLIATKSLTANNTIDEATVEYLSHRDPKSDISRLFKLEDQPVDSDRQANAFNSYDARVHGFTALQTLLQIYIELGQYNKALELVKPLLESPLFGTFGAPYFCSYTSFVHVAYWLGILFFIHCRFADAAAFFYSALHITHTYWDRKPSSDWTENQTRKIVSGISTLLKHSPLLSQYGYDLHHPCKIQLVNNPRTDSEGDLVEGLPTFLYLTTNPSQQFNDSCVVSGKIDLQFTEHQEEFHPLTETAFQNVNDLFTKAVALRRTALFSGTLNMDQVYEFCGGEEKFLEVVNLHNSIIDERPLADFACHNMRTSHESRLYPTCFTLVPGGKFIESDGKWMLENVSSISEHSLPNKSLIEEISLHTARYTAWLAKQ